MNYHDQTVLIVDDGLLLCLALMLSKVFKRVLYYCDKDEENNTVADFSIGEGFPQIERVLDLWDVKEQVDLFIFPRIGHAGLQLELQGQGKRVWGSRKGDELEIRKEWFRQMQPSLGLDVPQFEVVVGFSALRARLKLVKNKWVKVSRFRGNWETWHHQNYDLSRPELDLKEAEFGEFKEMVRFILEEHIETRIEWGGDHVVIGDQFGDHGVIGFEKKNKAYLAHCQPYAAMPAPMKEINAAVAPKLKAAGYRNFFSTEILRAGKRNILLEPTCRAGFPSGTCQFRFYKNLAEILTEGAAGRLVPIKRTKKYCVEAIIEHTGNAKAWRNLWVPRECQERVNVLEAGRPGPEELFCVAPFQDSTAVVGSINGMGDTVLEAIQDARKVKDALAGNPVHIHLAALEELVERARQAQRQGIVFTTDPLPSVEELKKAIG